MCLVDICNCNKLLIIYENIAVYQFKLEIRENKSYDCLKMHRLEINCVFL